MKMIGKQNAIKTFKKFTYRNATPITNILSHIHKQTQIIKVFQTIYVASQHCRTINRIFDIILLNHTLSFPTSHVATYLENSFSNQKYALPLNQGDFFYPGSLLTREDFFYLGSLLIQGNQLLLIGESSMASIFIIIFIHISLLSHQLYL